MQRRLCMYQQLYKEIIDNAKRQNRKKGQGVYYECHHIVPDFMFKNRKRKGPAGHLDGDPDHPDNIVLLTFQEHLMCHYYLYEIHKDNRYGYSAGTALQFFFTNVGQNHTRQINLTEIDQKLLDSMAHLRELGIASISKARKGKMPVVDAVTRLSIGSVPVDHPRVLSGEWVHHSRGQPGHRNGKSQKGKDNNNYKEITESQKERVINCIPSSVVDDVYVIKRRFIDAVKKELTEFRKVSYVCIENHIGKINEIVDLYNQKNHTSLIFNPYYRSSVTRNTLSEASKGWGWITDGEKNLRIRCEDIQSYLIENPTFRQGRKI